MKALQSFTFTGTLLVLLMVLTGWAQLPPGWAPGWLTARASAFGLLWSQRWTFFADEPTSVKIVGYQGDLERNVVSPITQVQTTRANRWGLSRVGIATTVQLESIVASLPKSAWEPCGQELDVCLPAWGAAPLITIASPASRPKVCGPTVIVEEVPSPWIGDLASLEPFVVKRFVEVDIRCPRPTG